MIATQELAPGLWRWTAPHPAWRPARKRDSPSDWPRDVGCVVAHAGADAVVVDPLVDDEDGWRWLAERTAGRPAHVLTTVSYHRRSRDEALERLSADREVPDGVEPFRLRGARETVFWLSGHRTLVPGDRLIGAAGGGIRMCPESWLDGGVRHPQLRELLAPLLDLPVERILVSHGEPVLAGAREALGAAIGG